MDKAPPPPCTTSIDWAWILHDEVNKRVREQHQGISYEDASILYLGYCKNLR